MEKKWYKLPIKDIFVDLKTNKEGLSSKSANFRLKKHGFNEFENKNNFYRFKIFLRQFKSPLIYILIIASAITFYMKDFADAWIILGAVGLNIIIGFIQENKAYSSLEKLKKIIKPYAYVLRDGIEKKILARNLVPGDIIVLKTGENVSADARIFEAKDLQINESILTGEWIAAEKEVKQIKQDSVIADRDNMAYMGTNIESGQGKAVVVETGSKTEIGKIAKILNKVEENQTPLQKKIASLSKITAIFIFLICIGIFVVGVVRHYNIADILTMAVVIAVSAIPEGLPIAITIVLSVGMKKILNNKGLVRHLNSAETLGSVTTICTDKTGTLTEAKMEVASIVSGKAGISLSKTCYSNILNQGHLQENIFVLNIAALCSEAVIENPYNELKKWVIHGRATDKALIYAAVQAGIDVNKFKKDLPVIFDIPFNSKNKYSANLRKISKNLGYFYLMGAPERIIERMEYFYDEEKIIKMNKSLKDAIIVKVNEMTKCGLRVIAVGYKEVKLNKNEHSLENNFIFVGLLGLKDPVRSDVKQTIHECQKAGINVIIVTGDHKLTAKAVAIEVGINLKNKIIVDGSQLEKMSDSYLKNILPRIAIFARVEPEQKLRIVQMLRERGEVVAMTGDGINDSPALKQADIGIALGSSTDVAKDTSDLVILDDSFNTLVSAIEEGRAIFDNIRKVIVYFFSDVLQEIILILGALALGLPLPVLPAQILWINLVEDSLPAMALALELKEKGIMDQKPRGISTPLLNKEMKFLIFIIGTITNILIFYIYYLLYHRGVDIEHLRSVIFVSIGFDALFYIYSCRSLKHSIWEFSFFSNKYLLISTIVGSLLLIAAIYVPFLQIILKTEALYLIDWAIVISFAFINVFLIELAKRYFIIKNQVE